MRHLSVPSLVLFLLVLVAASAQAKPPIRADFFAHYPSADGTVVADRSDGSRHCGMCHFDFNGGGARNHYGQRVEYYRGLGYTNDEAFTLIETEDPDADGFNSLTEIVDTGTYANTPTFPGLSNGDLGTVVNIDTAYISANITPTSTVDTTPPVVTVLAPAGGSFDAMTTTSIQWSATDENGIAVIDIYVSFDGGAVWKPAALGLSDTGSWTWFIPNRPGSVNLVRVVALDTSGNSDFGESSFFTINPVLGLAPTTMRDMDLPGTQPLEGPLLANPDTNCALCHGNYDTAVEPWSNWRGSMMSQAARDPIFFACMAISEQDAPSVGDLCIRCHSPRGWLAGRSNDTSAASLTTEDRVGISCDFCHKLVDPNYVSGVSPAEDADILAALAEVPAQSGNGQYVVTSNAAKRGPFSDALELGHPIQESPFHRESAICGTCHDVSNPVYDNLGGGDYGLNTFDAPHGTNLTHDMAPVERTYSEWQASEFATTGVDIPQFGGVVATCQDCHMRPVTGKGANDPAAPVRTDLPLHDFTGGNTFMPLLIGDAYASEVDAAQLSATIVRARDMLTRAARLELTPDPAGINVRVYNDTGHRLPSGYPEGRRIWLQVVAKDALDNVVYTSGDYDTSTGVLTHDADLKIYHIEPGISPALGAALSIPAGPSFHFVLNDSVYFDDRIPPRGFTNAAFEAMQSPPVDYTYADGQYWDDTFYALPNTAKQVTVTLYYQSTSKEYVEFLRDENTSNTTGQEMYDLWVAHGRSAPEVMNQSTVAVEVLTAVGDQDPKFSFALGAMLPNPMSSQGRFAFAIAQPGRVRLAVYDVRGRLIRVLEDETRPAGKYTMYFNGLDRNGNALASGVYFMRLESGGQVKTQRLTIVR